MMAKDNFETQAPKADQVIVDQSYQGGLQQGIKNPKPVKTPKFRWG